jgi:hypothetical protein
MRLGDKNASPEFPLITVMVKVLEPATKVPTGMAYSVKENPLSSML